MTKNANFKSFLIEWTNNLFNTNTMNSGGGNTNASKMDQITLQDKSIHWRGSYHPNVSSQSSQLRFGILTACYNILSSRPQKCFLYSEIKNFSFFIAISGLNVAIVIINFCSQILNRRIIGCYKCFDNYSHRCLF